MMNAYRRQAGLSLVTVAVVMALLALAAMAMLYSMRFGKLPWQDAWDHWRGNATVAEKLQGQLKEAVVPATSAEVRRCVVGGKVVYSNVECGDRSTGSRAVALHDSRGIEAPKVAPAPSSVTASSDELQSKLIDKAVSGGK
jgi:hypothetical protein